MRYNSKILLYLTCREQTSSDTPCGCPVHFVRLQPYKTYRQDTHKGRRY